MINQPTRAAARRDVLKLAASGILLLSGTQRSWGSKLLGAFPFSLGVASGDPWPDGFVLWTRLAPRPLEPAGGMPMKVVQVEWEVAEDERFSRIVRSGVEAARPELAHSVHVEVTGLKPAWRYWYRFRADGEISPIGTARTAPAAGAMTDRVRLGVAGCQHYEHGLFTAYRYLAAVEDLDLVFHYGDYIYEGRGRDCSKAKNCGRSHVGEELYSLDDYRRRHAQYKSDPDLQAAHAAAAFVMSYDDHEVDNNWSADRDQDGTPAEAFLLRRAMAMQAWYEHMPVRRAQHPSSGALTMYRRLDFGDLLRMHVLDTRQYRTEAVSILGSQQEQWLSEGLGSSAQWNLLAQQVMVMPFIYPRSRPAGRTNNDSWSGFAPGRQRLVSQIRERKLTNVVIATGDVHQHHAGTVPMHDEDLQGPAAATEFVCTSISSDGDGRELANGWEGVPADNPHCRLFNARRGYQTFDIGRSHWRTEVWTLDRVTTPGGKLSRRASFVIERGEVSLHQES